MTGRRSESEGRVSPQARLWFLRFTVSAAEHAMWPWEGSVDREGWVIQDKEPTAAG